MGTFYPKTNSGQAKGVKCYANETEVKQNARGYAKIVKVDGGWLVFDSITEYEAWRKQH